VTVPDVSLPIRYVEDTLMLAAFSAPRDRLRAHTPPELRVVTTRPGRSVVAIACFEYLRTSIGAYREVGVCWPVVHARHDPPPLLPLLVEQRWPGLGWWVHHLPVTTPIALDAGRRLWGDPKFLASIDFAWQDATRTCTLAESGAEILRLSIDTRMAARPVRFGMHTWSRRGDELLATRIDVDAVGLRRPFGRASLTLGPHPMGRELASLGVATERAVEVRWYPVYRALLPAAHVRRAVTDAPHAYAGARRDAHTGGA
jgi:hypothetical protein